jgi:hypothetical protein
MFSLEALFCHVDDFCCWFELLWQQQLLAEPASAATLPQLVFE